MTQPIDVWNEIRVTSEGISITLFSESTGTGAIVEDEAWFTFSELEARPQSENAPLSLNLSEETRAALSENPPLSPDADELFEEMGLDDADIDEVTLSPGDTVYDAMPPEWSENNTLVVVNVADERADAYAIEEAKYDWQSEKTVYDANPSFDPDDRVIECVYLDDTTIPQDDSVQRLARSMGKSAFDEEDVYAFPEGRLNI